MVRRSCMTVLAVLALGAVSSAAAQDTAVYYFSGNKQVGARAATKIRSGEALSFVITKDLDFATPHFAFRSPRTRPVFENRGKVSFLMEVFRGGASIWFAESSGRIGEALSATLEEDPYEFNWSLPIGPHLLQGDEVLVTTRLRGFPALKKDERYVLVGWFGGESTPAQPPNGSRREHRLGRSPPKRWSQLWAAASAVAPFGGSVPAPKSFETAMILPEEYKTRLICLRGEALVCEPCGLDPRCVPSCSEKERIKAKAVVEILGVDGSTETLKLTYNKRRNGFWRCSKFEQTLEAGDAVFSRLSLKKSLRELDVVGELVGASVFLLD